MPVVPFANRPAAEGPSLPEPPDEPWVLMAAAQMHSEGRLVESKPMLEAGAGRSGGGASGSPTYAHPQHLENAATEWARGNISNQQFRDLVRKEGWSIEPQELQRSRKSTIDIFDPSGKMHNLQP